MEDNKIYSVYVVLSTGDRYCLGCTEDSEVIEKILELNKLPRYKALAAKARKKSAGVKDFFSIQIAYTITLDDINRHVEILWGKQSKEKLEKI